MPKIYSAAQAIMALGGHPDHRINYEKYSREFIGIEVTMRFLFADRKNLLGLEIGSNYGLYLHYLKYMQGINGISGIDIDPFAVKYGQSLGLPVCEGDARQLTASAGSLDVVITQHFLDPDYLSFPVWVVQEGVHRVLKPGAYHISDSEVNTWNPLDHGIARNLFSHHGFAEDVKVEMRELRNICIFQRI